MIRLFNGCEAAPALPDVTAGDWVLPRGTTWIDLVDPTREEELAVERVLNLPVPTREEMAEIEISSRLYRERGSTFITANLLFNTDAEAPSVGPVTFILTPGPLVTLRYFDPRAFRLLIDKAQREPSLCEGAVPTFLNLMEAVVDRTADVLERSAAEVEALSADIFTEGRTNYGRALQRLGRAQQAIARIADSLTGLDRAFSFAALDQRIEQSPEAREHLRSLSRDVVSLNAHAASVAQGVNFQLNAALGLINIEQSGIIKIFSVAAVAFLPPTLIASIYGMNFDHMPELAQPWGYPAALLAMVASAVLPLWWFRRRGWL